MLSQWYKRAGSGKGGTEEAGLWLSIRPIAAITQFFSLLESLSHFMRYTGLVRQWRYMHPWP